MVRSIYFVVCGAALLFSILLVGLSPHFAGHKYAKLFCKILNAPTAKTEIWPRGICLGYTGFFTAKSVSDFPKPQGTNVLDEVK